MLICPICRSALQTSDQNAIVCTCGEVYPKLPSGGLDFLQGAEFADFELDETDPAQRLLLEQEGAGVAARVKDFFLPMMSAYARSTGKKLLHLSILDCGCGNGLSVDLFAEQGMGAWGIDAGRARHRQWQQRQAGVRLLSADALKLPFKTAAFDVVLSSGLIEHIGIHEEEVDGYRSWRLVDCEEKRRRFIAELVRVLKHDGFILLDHPNGAFPADFWHGGKAGSIRWHKSHGDMLPRFSEVAYFFHQADPSLRLISLSPNRRLSFNKVSAHWYGRIFAPAMRTWLRIMEWRAMRFLARSFLNPYLITIASRLPRPFIPVFYE
jgi:SAM-dependent methyltransferase